MYVKGKSGNYRGRHSTPLHELRFHAALRLEIEKTDGNEIKLQKIARALVKQAIAGDIAAIKEVADRIDGKVPQRIAADGDSNTPMVLVVRWGNEAHPIQARTDDKFAASGMNGISELPMLELKANGGNINS